MPRSLSFFLLFLVGNVVQSADLDPHVRKHLLATVQVKAIGSSIVGTGVITEVDRAEYPNLIHEGEDLVITAQHVITKMPNGSEVVVDLTKLMRAVNGVEGTTTGVRCRARIITTTTDILNQGDLALLAVTLPKGGAEPFQRLLLADKAATWREDEKIFVYGTTPNGAPWKGETWPLRVNTGTKLSAFITDCHRPPGVSGGPAVDRSDRILGICWGFNTAQIAVRDQTATLTMEINREKNVTANRALPAEHAKRFTGSCGFFSDTAKVRELLKETSRQLSSREATVQAR